MVDEVQKQVCEMERNEWVKAGSYAYSSYWRTWDRVVDVVGTRIFVVALTPINNNWQDGSTGKFRYHSTLIEPENLHTALPADVEKEVREHGLGWALDMPVAVDAM